MSQKRAPWYRCVVQVGGAAIDVTLSDENEAKLAAAVARTGEPMQLWASRWDGSVEQLTVVPGSGVRYVVREARPIPIVRMQDGNERPAMQNEQPTGEVAPTDTRYPQFARPALLREVPYPVHDQEGVAATERLITAVVQLTSAVRALSAPASTLPKEAS